MRTVQVTVHRAINSLSELINGRSIITPTDKKRRFRSVLSGHIGRCALSTIVVIGYLCIFSFIKSSTNRVENGETTPPPPCDRRVKTSETRQESAPRNIIVKIVCCETLRRLFGYVLVCVHIFQSNNFDGHRFDEKTT